MEPGGLLRVNEAHAGQGGLVPQVFLGAMVPAPPPKQNINAGISGNWFNPTANQGGHGFQIEILPNNGMLVIWFVFNPAGTAQNWIYSQGTYDPSSNDTTLPAFLALLADTGPARDRALTVEELQAAGITHIHVAAIDYSALVTTTDLEETPGDEGGLWDGLIQALLSGQPVVGGGGMPIPRERYSAETIASLFRGGPGAGGPGPGGPGGDVSFRHLHRHGEPGRRPGPRLALRLYHERIAGWASDYGQSLRRSAPAALRRGLHAGLPGHCGGRRRDDVTATPSRNFRSPASLAS